MGAERPVSQIGNWLYTRFLRRQAPVQTGGENDRRGADKNIPFPCFGLDGPPWNVRLGLCYGQAPKRGCAAHPRRAAWACAALLQPFNIKEN